MEPQLVSKIRNRIIVSLVIIVLLALTVFSFVQYVRVSAELADAQVQLSTQTLNQKIIVFAQSFIDDVLKSNTEISFEQRLKLENEVRELKDEEVMSRWSKFVNSQTEAEAQDNVKELLSLLVHKIRM